MPVTLSSPVAVVLLPAIAIASAPPDPLLIIILHEPALICSFVRNNIILNTFHPPPILSTKRYYRLPRRHPPTAYSLRTAMMRCDSVLDRILSQTPATPDMKPTSLPCSRSLCPPPTACSSCYYGWMMVVVVVRHRVNK